MSFNRDFYRIREEGKNSSFFKIFQGADLSSENMRAFPYDFISRVSPKDFSYKMLITAKWGSSWEVKVSKNQRFYYMDKLGWNQFVSDNALGENEFITFTHKGNMCFNANIYDQNGVEILRTRNLQKMNSSSQVKKEPGESSNKDEKKNEETGESPGGVKRQVRKKKYEETGESPGGVKRKVRKNKYEESNTSKKKIKSKNGDQEFTITIRKTYLKFLTIPKKFLEHMPNESKNFRIHHLDGKHSWKVYCLVRKNRVVFNCGWTQMAREYPLQIDDICTFKLIKPTEFLLVVSRKA